MQRELTRERVRPRDSYGSGHTWAAIQEAVTSFRYHVTSWPSGSRLSDATDSHTVHTTSQHASVIELNYDLASSDMYRRLLWNPDNIWACEESQLEKKLAETPRFISVCFFYIL